MPLDPHVKSLLNILVAAGVPEASQLTPLEMRERFIRLAELVDAKDVPIGKIEHGTLPGPAGPIQIRIYTPRNPHARQLAGLIYFHGGCGVFGNLDTHDGICRMLANESDCRVIAVEYRLAPEHPFPAAVEDSYAATRWVARHALELGIDRDRIAIGGDSAGGNLAAVVCQLVKQTAEFDLALQVLLYPAMNVNVETESRRAFGQGYFLDNATLDWALKYYGPTQIDLKDPRLCPLHATDLSGLPPAHIHTAEFDPLRDEGKAYADRLERAGVKVRYTCHQGMIHHFYAMAGVIPYARAAINATGIAIKDALA